MKIYANYSFLTFSPELAREWHPTKNGEMTAADVTPHSSHKAWWVCKKGHEWTTTVSERQNGSRCPYCSKRRASKEYNLEVEDPELAAEWHPTKNGKLTPSQVTPHSSKKIWWQCIFEHEWETTVSSRSSGSNCPYCYGRFASAHNNLKVLRPELAAEWHPTKNGELTPEMVTPASNKRVWWQCKDGHEWHAVMCHRIKTGCPVCAKTKMKVKSGTTLAEASPELTEQWHPTKNEGMRLTHHVTKEKSIILTPETVAPGSHKYVWWVCEHGHEWLAEIRKRFKGTGCPYCSGNKVSDENNLETVYPELAEQWHPTKNGDLKPAEITPGSKRKIWWQCEKGHEWLTSSLIRTRGCGCPHCSRENRRQKRKKP